MASSERLDARRDAECSTKPSAACSAADSTLSASHAIDPAATCQAAERSRRFDSATDDHQSVLHVRFRKGSTNTGRVAERFVREVIGPVRPDRCACGPTRVLVDEGIDLQPQRPVRNATRVAARNDHRPGGCHQPCRLGWRHSSGALILLRACVRYGHCPESAQKVGMSASSYCSTSSNPPSAVNWRTMPEMNWLRWFSASKS